MSLIDVTIVNVALPSMQANMGASSSQIEWVVAAFVLSFALFLLPFGRLGDIVGRKRMFLIGVTAFTIGSALCGLAPTIETLIGARARETTPRFRRSEPGSWRAILAASSPLSWPTLRRHHTDGEE